MSEFSEIKKFSYEEDIPITIKLSLDNLKTITLLLMVLNITINDYVSNQYLTYFSQRLLGYIGIWLSFAPTLFMYLLGRGYFFNNPFQFSYILWTSLYQYVPLLFALVFFVLPVSIYFMPEFPSWYLKSYTNTKNVYFIDFYSSYLQYMKNSLIKDNIKSQVFNRILFWCSVPFIQITIYPFTIILLESALIIKEMRDNIKDENETLLEYPEDTMNSQNYLENLAKNSYLNYFWNIRTISCILMTFVLLLIHIYIIEINKKRAPKIQYPIILTWSFFFIILLIILVELLSRYFKNYEVIMKLYIITGILLAIVPCIFTYAQDNISSRHYYYTSIFLLGIWDSLFEMITGKGSLHHFSHSGIILIYFTSIFIFAIATGSRLLWLFDFTNDFEIASRMKCIGSIGMSICLYYMTITKEIEFKRSCINKLKELCILYPNISFYGIFIPSRETLWNILEEDALLLLTFIPITTIGITTVLTKNLLFGAFESFVTVFLSPMIWLILFNIDRIFIHIYTSFK